MCSARVPTTARRSIAGAPVWRAGANQSTRLTTEVPLTIGGKTVPAGQLQPLRRAEVADRVDPDRLDWGAKKTGNDPTPDTLWGSYNYTPDKDVVRVADDGVEEPGLGRSAHLGLPRRHREGGKMFLAWDTANAMVPFTVAK